MARKLPPLKPKMTYSMAEGDCLSLADKLGMPLDKKIIPLVAALRMFGVRTTASCQGHINWGLPYPWINIDGRDAVLAGRLIGAADPGNPMWLNIRNKKKKWREATWVFEPIGDTLRLIPRDVSLPLRTLQRRAEKLAQNIKARDTTG